MVHFSAVGPLLAGLLVRGTWFGNRDHISTTAFVLPLEAQNKCRQLQYGVGLVRWRNQFCFWQWRENERKTEIISVNFGKYVSVKQSIRNDRIIPRIATRGHAFTRRNFKMLVKNKGGYTMKKTLKTTDSNTWKKSVLNHKSSRSGI